MDTKFCTRCEIEKPLAEFNKNKRQNDGFQSYCKICHKEYVQQNKEQLKIYYQDWLENNRENRNLSNQKYRENNRQKFRDYYKKYRSKPSFKENRRNYEKTKEKHLIYLKLRVI